ncbi:conserved hypothetical protein [Culex quinquefasciatus]|uniref:Uncharacterized protein n=1 Tax=Culex quinquefasciatus TaxID=7176 RepID=B0WIG8_CULQU|nr:conserved hypothetical protein [Culex quinquefasciatus]|eukprot:XP_001848502.1 conserved hypothetical protein [Culex quinquefasciatus]
MAEAFLEYKFNYDPITMRKKLYMLPQFLGWQPTIHSISRLGPFVKRYELTYRWLSEAGLFQHWKEDTNLVWVQHKWNSLTVLGWHDLLSLWYILGIGFALSSVLPADREPYYCILNSGTQRHMIQEAFRDISRNGQQQIIVASKDVLIPSEKITHFLITFDDDSWEHTEHQFLQLFRLRCWNNLGYFVFLTYLAKMFSYILNEQYEPHLMSLEEFERTTIPVCTDFKVDQIYRENVQNTRS